MEHEMDRECSLSAAMILGHWGEEGVELEGKVLHLLASPRFRPSTMLRISGWRSQKQRPIWALCRGLLGWALETGQSRAAAPLLLCAKSAQHRGSGIWSRCLFFASLKRFSMQGKLGKNAWPIKCLCLPPRDQCSFLSRIIEKTPDCGTTEYLISRVCFQPSGKTANIDWPSCTLPASLFFSLEETQCS